MSSNNRSDEVDIFLVILMVIGTALLAGIAGFIFGHWIIR